MKLNDDEVQAVYYGLADFVRQRGIAGRPVPLEVHHVFQRFDTTVRLSRKRHETGCGGRDEGPSESETRMGSPDVAEFLNWSKRQVQRHALELRGRIISGRWIFRESDVIEFAERLATHGRTGPDG